MLEALIPYVAVGDAVFRFVDGGKGEQAEAVRAMCRRATNGTAFYLASLLVLVYTGVGATKEMALYYFLADILFGSLDVATLFHHVTQINLLFYPEDWCSGSLIAVADVPMLLRQLGDLLVVAGEIEPRGGVRDVLGHLFQVCYLCSSLWIIGLLAERSFLFAGIYVVNTGLMLEWQT